MTDIASTAWIWAAKGTGALAGSALSLVYMLPKTRREAAARLAAGMIAGLVFGGAVGIKIIDKLGIGAAIGPSEMVLIGSATASAAAWWVLGAAARFLKFERDLARYRVERQNETETGETNDESQTDVKPGQ